ncbi:MAG: Asp23/Gls24 family envelope stress response protein [Anaerolineales bacterium]|nr:Asp23/Gls24 family envelope stress response protein [Anaerolineales bacterium]
MDQNTRPPGKTTVAPDVLVQIARMAALKVAGVHAMAPVTGGVNRLFRRGIGDGVRISIEEDIVSVDLYVIMDKEVNIRDTSRNAQKEVTRAIQEMVGMDVNEVNIHIEDIAYEETADEA